MADPTITIDLPLDPPFRFENPGWEWDEAADVEEFYRQSGDDRYIQLELRMGEGMKEIALIRKNPEGAIVETLLVSLHHEHHKETTYA